MSSIPPMVKPRRKMPVSTLRLALLAVTAILIPGVAQWMLVILIRRAVQSEAARMALYFYLALGTVAGACLGTMAACRAIPMLCPCDASSLIVQ